MNRGFSRGLALLGLLLPGWMWGCRTPEERFHAAFEEIRTDSLHIYEIFAYDTIDARETPRVSVPKGPLIEKELFLEVTGLTTDGIDTIFAGYAIPNGDQQMLYLFRSCGAGYFHLHNDNGIDTVLVGEVSILLMVADSMGGKAEQLMPAGDRSSVKSADGDFNSWLIDLDSDGDLDLVRRINFLPYGYISSKADEKGLDEKVLMKKEMMDILETYIWENGRFLPPTTRDVRKKEKRFRFKITDWRDNYRKGWGKYPY